MAFQSNKTLCVLGCGNLGAAILSNLIAPEQNENSQKVGYTKFIACVRSEKTQKRLQEKFQEQSPSLSVRRGDNLNAVTGSDVVILGIDPADIEITLTEPGLSDALRDKLLISVVAGWTRQKLEITLYGSPTTSHNQSGRAYVIRALPNIAALVEESLTAIEISEPNLSDDQIQLVEAIFEKIGRVVRITPRLMDATTAVSGSTPAFFAIICDALIDAAVAVGVPRDMAQTMIIQAMKGTAAILQSGTHPGLLKDQGTSPEGCTIGGVMVLEEAGLRGTVGRALREAVTIARLMGTVEHVNDTRNHTRCPG